MYLKGMVVNYYPYKNWKYFLFLFSQFLTEPASPYKMKAKVNTLNVAKSTLFALYFLVTGIPRSGSCAGGILPGTCMCLVMRNTVPEIIQ